MSLMVGSWLLAITLVLFRLTVRVAEKAGPDALIHKWLVGEVIACGLSGSFFFSLSFLVRAAVRPGNGATEMAAAAVALAAVAAAVVGLRLLRPKRHAPATGVMTPRVPA